MGVIHWYSDIQLMRLIHWYSDAQSRGYSVTIVITRDIIYTGSQWRVRDGRDIVFTHKWLPHTLTPLHEGALDIRVRELIDEDSRQWDRGKLEAMFTQNTVQEIMIAVPLTNLHSHDTLVWMENKAQKFTVKITYQVALRLENLAGQHSTARDYCPVWNKVWSLNVPPKVRVFLWRACSNCLPTKNLHRHKVRVEMRCEICRQQPETVSHILWECPFAQNVWALFKGKTQKCSNIASDFFLLFQQVQRKLSQQELEKWAVTAGQYGMREIKFTSNTSKLIQR
ncbi:hypothetical protein SO802_031787 [Lithocarpus litseifolius]|uniref:Reverse transcriptase zinc-binding domain-containing protein n=1 Tax=Lithocarpus litseifolius TaxID=425828 RepID=A0AAW2BL83_9ROSI